MNKNHGMLICSMLIFGSLGLFVQPLLLPASLTALFRAVLGSLFLLVFFLLQKNRLDGNELKSVKWPLLVSGTLLGLNWVLLFEAYKRTTVPAATLCYYFAPVLVAVFTWIQHPRSFGMRRLAALFLAVLGLVLLLNPGSALGPAPLSGILYGLSAALVYAGIILINPRLRTLSGLESAMLQLMIAAAVLLPYVMLQSSFSSLMLLTAADWLRLGFVGIVHTGLAYLLYFTAVSRLKPLESALMSYIDPISAVVFAMIFLQETLSWGQLAGAFFILGASWLLDR